MKDNEYKSDPVKEMIRINIVVSLSLLVLVNAAYVVLRLFGF